MTIEAYSRIEQFIDWPDRARNGLQNICRSLVVAVVCLVVMCSFVMAAIFLTIFVCTTTIGQIGFALVLLAMFIYAFTKGNDEA